MSYTSPEILTLEAIQSWIASLSVWQAWTELDETASRARVVWPLKSAPTLPVCVLALNAGRTVNLTGAAGGSNFQRLVPSRSGCTQPTPRRQIHRPDTQISPTSFTT
jgi:hypothetical protein